MTFGRLIALLQPIPCLPGRPLWFWGLLNGRNALVGDRDPGPGFFHVVFRSIFSVFSLFLPGHCGQDAIFQFLWRIDWMRDEGPIFLDLECGRHLSLPLLVVLDAAKFCKVVIAHWGGLWIDPGLEAGGLFM